jgi:hypothetical protein
MPQFSDDLFLGTAQGYIGTNVTNNEAVITGSVTGTTMTVTAMNSGDSLTLGQYVNGTGITANSYITAFVTGAGGTGTYTLSASSSATGSITIYASGNYGLQDPSPMEVGVGPLGREYVWDVIPQTLNTSNIAASQTPAASGNLTLTAGTNAKSFLRNDGTTVIQLDTPRAVQLTTASGTISTSRNLTVSGYDYYGQAMSEVIATGTTSSAVANVSGKKAFYQISSIAINGSLPVAITVGTTDILGLPLRVFDAGYLVRVGWNNTLANDTGGNSAFTVADLTTPATSTTGDVRGTYVPSTASNGVKRLVVVIALPGIAAGPNATRTGALGVTQA